MTANALAQPRFVRRTRLGANEYRKNFHQIDMDVISAVSSPEADLVTPLMSKIYLRLASAPAEYREADGVLHFRPGEEDGRPVKASKVLYKLLGVASATAHKALQWMQEQGIIGYFSGKNGAGIRIFLNRAANSIGVKGNQPDKKILPFARGSNGAVHGSTAEPAFKDSYAVKREILDLVESPHAPENGADAKTVAEGPPEPPVRPDPGTHTPDRAAGREAASAERLQATLALALDEIVKRLKSELEPGVKSAATQAASMIAAREVARTREWFETKALPKAVRVAQHETYDLLRKHGYADERSRHGRTELAVGRGAPDCQVQPPTARNLTPEEVGETAEACLALFEAQGKSVDVTLAEISSESGGWLPARDVPRVREAVQTLLLRRTNVPTGR